MSWLQTLADGRQRLRLAECAERVLGPVRTVAEGSGWFVNWADFPSVVSASDGTLAAHWLEYLGEGRYAYGVRVSCSRDGGQRWSTPRWLHTDRSETEHGFASLVPLDSGHFAAVWLDGRDLERTGAMTLRATAIDADGASTSGEVLLDSRVCECCTTDAVDAAGTLIAVYRDRSEEEVRDISVVRRVDGAWSEPVPLRADGWRIPG